MVPESSANAQYTLVALRQADSHCLVAVHVPDAPPQELVVVLNVPEAVVKGWNVPSNAPSGLVKLPPVIGVSDLPPFGPSAIETVGPEIPVVLVTASSLGHSGPSRLTASIFQGKGYLKVLNYSIR